MKEHLLRILTSSRLRVRLKEVLSLPGVDNIDEAILFTLGQPDYRMNEFKTTGIAALDQRRILSTTLSSRAKNVLNEHHIYTVKDLLQVDPNKVIKWRNAGIKTTQEIVQFMQDINSKKV